MDFEFDSADTLQISDAEISELLTQVYVDGGFTEGEIAKTLFEPASVRRRGMLFCAREKLSSELAGMIILVPPESEACRMATGNEVEIHLLGVKSKYRGMGLGRELVAKLISLAQDEGRSRIVLWTQPTMKAAQKLYESFDFFHVKDIELGSRQFLLYYREL